VLLAGILWAAPLWAEVEVSHYELTYRPSAHFNVQLTLVYRTNDVTSACLGSSGGAR
jgi:hypothetical protein